jgi:hypothetical protein
MPAGRRARQTSIAKIFEATDIVRQRLSADRAATRKKRPTAVLRAGQPTVSQRPHGFRRIGSCG